MGCSSSAQAQNVERSPQPVQVAASQTAANQSGGGSDMLPQPNVAPTKPVQIESTTTAEKNQVVHDQIDAPSTGN